MNVGRGVLEATMDCYQFIASIFSSIMSLAWPIAVFACVWLFREKLNTLLPLLRMRYKDLDISFRFDEAEKEAALLPPSPDTVLEPTPEEKDKFEKIAEISPKAAILEVRSDIEEALRSAARSNKSLDTRSLSMLPLIRSLRNKEIIDPQTSALLDDLRVIGNNAMHGSDTEFTKEDALRYRSLADQCIGHLRATTGSN